LHVHVCPSIPISWILGLHHLNDSQQGLMFRITLNSTTSILDPITYIVLRADLNVWRRLDIILTSHTSISRQPLPY
jgi:hypothetical protein